MKRFIPCLLLAVLLVSMSSCATTHLWRWGMDKTSAVHTIDNDEIDAFVRPSSTVIGTPFAIAWDVATFPPQIIFSIDPYGDRHMSPAEKKQ